MIYRSCYIYEGEVRSFRPEKLFLDFFAFIFQHDFYNADFNSLILAIVTADFVCTVMVAKYGNFLFTSSLKRCDEFT